MPARNIVKIYAEDCFYHIYNRGVDKQLIFRDTKDYAKFLSILKDALSPPRSIESLVTELSAQGSTFSRIPKQPKNFYESMELHAYCLMPNHFHFLVKQKDAHTIKAFMQSIVTRYSMYFNLKYKRTGHLFTGIYKASLVLDDPYLLHVSRYIHRNPMSLGIPINQGYSSYAIYLSNIETTWLKTKTILGYFDQATLPISIKSNSYDHFVEYEKFENTPIDVDLEGFNLF